MLIATILKKKKKKTQKATHDSPYELLWVKRFLLDQSIAEIDSFNIDAVDLASVQKYHFQNKSRRCVITDELGMGIKHCLCLFRIDLCTCSLTRPSCWL